MKLKDNFQKEIYTHIKIILFFINNYSVLFQVKNICLEKDWKWLYWDIVCGDESNLQFFIFYEKKNEVER